jgi:hypothetical protein
MITEALAILTDPAHVLAEATFACIEASIGALVGAVLVRRHDRRHHPKPVVPKAPSSGWPAGLEFIVDPHCPPDTAYLLNTKTLVGDGKLRKALITDLRTS